MNAPAPPPSPQPPAPQGVGAQPRGSWPSLVLILVIVVGCSQAWQWWRDEQAARLIQRHATPADITLYTTSTCPYCAKARAWLREHGIAWRECNVEQDADCMARYTAQGAPGVPLVHAKGQWHLGFDPAWLGQVLEMASASQRAQAASSSPRRDSAPLP